MDVDLEMDALYHPEKYPLVSKVLEASEDYAPGNQPGPELGKIEATVLALLQLTLHDERRAWKGFDFDVMDSLFEKGYILNSANKTKSVVLTDKGLARSRELFEEFYGKR